MNTNTRTFAAAKRDLLATFALWTGRRYLGELYAALRDGKL